MKSTNILKISLLILFVISSTQLLSQRSDMRYGRVDDALVKMERYEADTTANAVILGDYGEIEIFFDQREGFQCRYTRHLRVKIFNRDAFDLANFKIGLITSGHGGDRLTRLRGVVFSPEDGKINRERFRRRDSFDEEVSPYYKYVVFTLPNIREGSVFDLEYTIISSGLHVLPDWQFQGFYPKEVSELKIVIPEFFTYNPLMYGFVPLTERETYTTREAKFNFTNYVTVYRIENVPAFTREPYMNSAINFLSRIEHELTHFSSPWYSKDYSSNWIKLNKTLVESNSFGKQLERSGFISDEIAEIAENNEESFDRMIAAHSLIQNEMTWNNVNSMYINNSLRRAWNNKEGSSADINMLLVLMLRELNIEANPVILSTRANGMINPAQLMLSKYNYVIASAEIGGEMYLLDATDKHAPYYLLPRRCINGQGRLISETRGRWVDLEVVSDNHMNTMANLKVHECGSIDVIINRTKSNYLKYNMVSDYRKYDDDEEYMDDFEAAHQGIELVSFNIENHDDWSEPLISTYEFKINEIDPTPKDIIYVNPFTIDRLESNPFRLEERLFPVDFVYPSKRTYNITIEIPEGYIVDEMPRGTRSSLPRRAGLLVARYSVEDNIISVEFEIDLQKAMFLTNEYQDLRSFYSRLVEEQARQIVLKKL